MTLDSSYPVGEEMDWRVFEPTNKSKSPKPPLGEPLPPSSIAQRCTSACLSCSFGSHGTLDT